MQDTRIAVVQMQSHIGKVRENLDKIEFFVDQAVKKQVDVICFPELSVQGYSRAKAQFTAEPISGESAGFIRQLAQESGIVVLVGMAESQEQGKPFITQLVALPDGNLKKYRKTHLGKSEEQFFASGDCFPVFDFGKARFGVQICWDLHFPEMTAILSLNGCEIVFAPHASPSIIGDRRDIWLKYLSARAYDNSVFLAACNLIGDNNDNQTFCGGALVVDPKGTVIAEAFNDREEMLIADLDAGLINTIRQKERTSMRNSFFLTARRPELYGDLLHPTVDATNGEDK